MTIQEQFVVTQTEVMRQLLQTQQQLAQQLQNNPRGENIDSLPRVTKYEHFYGMKPPTFEGAREPLAADAWIRAIEAKFSVFTWPCSEERKASFAALQLRGAVLIWWENFKTMISTGHKSRGLNSSRPSRNITFLKVSWIER
jgi:transcription initiation factor TFIID subunit TAF12